MKIKLKVNLSRELILDIERSGTNTGNKPEVSKTFQLTSDPLLLSDLSGWIGAVTVRAILHELGVNEHHVFKWKPENKYFQYLIFNHYIPGCMPRTLLLSELLATEGWVESIRMLIAKGYFIKANLGFGSGKRMNFDRTTSFEQILREYLAEPTSGEGWMLQKKLRLTKEFRVHSFNKDILYGLTFRISGKNESDDFDAPQEYVLQMLDKLPAALLEGTLIGWDIGLTKKGKYYVIEANFTGFHRQYRPGFQTSGYLDEPPFGSVICAWLNTYFSNKYRVSISSVEHSLLAKFPFLEEFYYYISIFKAEHMAALIKSKGRVEAVYVYLGEKTHYYMINLVSYFQVANFADVFFLITKDDLQQQAERIFRGLNVVHLAEKHLFTKNQYQKVRQMDEEQRKDLCCKYAIKRTKAASYIVI